MILPQSVKVREGYVKENVKGVFVTESFLGSVSGLPFTFLGPELTVSGPRFPSET